MQRRTWAPLAPASLVCLLFACLLVSLVSPRASAAVSGFTPAPGYRADAIGLTADTFAVAPDGRFATGTGSASGATVTVYNHAAPANRRVLATYNEPQLTFLGGMAFSERDTLLLSENGRQKTVFALSLSTGAIWPLAQPGALANLAQVRVRPTDGAVFVVEANGPKRNAVYRLENGAASLFAGGLGAGYLGGLAFDAAGNVFVADTNDPFFMGNPGRILALGPGGNLFGAVDLAGGQGSGVYDVTSDRRGAFYATTGATVTIATPSGARPVGAFSGMFPFPTDIAVDSEGGILVNGGFTDVGGIFRITSANPFRVPVPLPLPSASFAPARLGR